MLNSQEGIRLTFVEHDDGSFDRLVRARLRGLRRAKGLSLDDLAARTHLSASTISRIETGKRTISLDMLQPLCRALQTDVASLLDDTSDDDVVIRPVATRAHGHTTWPLSRSGSGVIALKMRMEPSTDEPDPQVHPGHDWFFVLSGVVELTLGDRTIPVEAGEAAEFSTMTPHAIRARGETAELLMIFDRDGQHAHLENRAGD